MNQIEDKLKLKWTKKKQEVKESKVQTIKQMFEKVSSEKVKKWEVKWK